MTQEQALQALHSENERLGLYKDVYAQRTWVGLTDEEQQELYDQWQGDGWGSFYQAIEAKLKEKNT